MNIAPLKAAGATGLVMLALATATSAAVARGPVPAPSPGIHPQATSTSRSHCPCSDGIVPWPPEAIAHKAPSATVADLMRSGGGQPGDVSSRAKPSQASVGTAVRRLHPETGVFDWAAAAVGAGAAAGIGLLLAAAVRAISRRRWHAEVTAGIRR